MLTQKWQQMYQEKLTGFDQALSRIKSGDRICVGMLAVEPSGFLSRLHTIADRVQDVRVFGTLLLGKYEWLLNPAYAGTFKHESWFFGGPARQAAASHQGALFIPNNLHRSGIDRYQAAPLNVLVTTVSPMDQHGYFSLSLSATNETWALKSADLVIVEVSEHAPRTFGDTLLHVSQVDCIVEDHHPLFAFPNVRPGPVEEQIAGHVAEMIEDGATLQLGIGGIPNAIAAFLKEKRDLGVHTEMLVDGMLDLYERGVITNAHKSINRFKWIAAFAGGSRRLYDWLHDNPSVEFREAYYTNNPYVLAQNYKMTSINTAIAVDLTGQVCSESLGPVHYSGAGGQRDTHVGSWMSEGGKGIICLRSTAKDGAISTITPTLAPGSAVTMTRHDVDYVVTEQGVAHLRGLSVADRARQLIAIAHPAFREELFHGARKYGWL